MNKQGNTLLIALVLMLSLTTLGMIFLHTVQSYQLLAVERSLYRPTRIMLESLVVHACRREGAAWLERASKTAGAEPHTSYTLSINGVMYTVRAYVEKNTVCVRASCLDKHAHEQSVAAELGQVQQKAIIRTWLRH